MRYIQTKPLCLLIACTAFAASGLSYAHKGELDRYSCHEDGNGVHCHLTDNEVYKAIDPDELELCDLSRKLPKFKKRHYRHWLDQDNDKLNTREEVLERDTITNGILFEINIDEAEGEIIDGGWFDPYTASYIDKPRRVSVTHTVPLKEAHRSGAAFWFRERKRAFANDLMNNASLKVVSKRAHRDRKDLDPAEWMPDNLDYWCRYIDDWVSVKNQWGLCYDENEKKEVLSINQECTENVE